VSQLPARSVVLKDRTTYQITFKSGKVVSLHAITAVDYYDGHLYFSDGDATYTFRLDEIVSSERVAR
jgi:hypothetical protein